MANDIGNALGGMAKIFGTLIQAQATAMKNAGMTDAQGKELTGKFKAGGAAALSAPEKALMHKFANEFLAAMRTAAPDLGTEGAQMLTKMEGEFGGMLKALE